MIILPAIDIKDGNCVRLQKGDYATAHKVADSPYETAKRFKDAGAEWMHMVDLDGAKDAKLINADLIADGDCWWRSAAASAAWRRWRIISAAASTA